MTKDFNFLGTGLNHTMGGKKLGFYTTRLPFATMHACGEYFQVRLNIEMMSDRYATVKFAVYDDEEELYPLHLIPLLLAEYLDITKS